MTLKERVNSTVRFVRYQDGNLIYRVAVDNFEFPVPIADCGSARFEAVDKGIIFMRWIRKHMENLAAGIKAADGTEEKVRGC